MTTLDELQSEVTAEAFVSLVRRVGREIVMPRFRNLDASEIDTKADASDLVTIADREAEVALAEGARSILPGCAVVGEEAVADDPDLLSNVATAETCVVIDPVDGTFNFARGVAVFGIILAVVHKGQTVFGLLYDPVMDDWAIARRGQGAEFVDAQGRRRRLATRPCAGLAEAEGTVPLDLATGPRRIETLRAVADVRAARSLRCSCHEYRMLAMGQADFSVNASVKVWDHAAGVLLLQEAGGHVELEDGSPYAPTRRGGWIFAAGSQALAADLRALDWPESGS
ncbi:inositol monophosphatase family protein [Psychromarinibacter sp. S121]|uniref:inositol monophosphatase family protein n=1 Tax=Psychromarinibacter sp. S121 TaxID=3415127 RepID=UPI003C7DC61A